MRTLWQNLERVHRGRLLPYILRCQPTLRERVTVALGVTVLGLIYPRTCYWVLSDSTIICKHCGDPFNVHVGQRLRCLYQPTHFKTKD